MAEKTLEIMRASASTAAAPGIRQAEAVSKFIDTTTCIGCKSCEVACQQWNDLAPEFTVQFGSYQTLPELEPRFWNLIRFNETQVNGSLAWLMRKDQCMHCADPGCLVACPAPNAVVQYANGIVDFNQEACIGCGYCIAGCPFNIPKLSKQTSRVYKCTLCVDRVSVGLEPACIKACPTGCLQFGSKATLLGIAGRRVAQLKANGFPNAGIYDPAGVGGTGVVTVLAHADQPELYRLPKDPSVPAAVTLWKYPIKWLGNIGMVAGVLIASLHYLRYGPKHVPEDDKPKDDQKGAAG
ncbi:MAG: formate dehydrogenase subunit beta [Candidatus Solibacter sp.]|jgi:formate dehydrogenase beta subunit